MAEFGYHTVGAGGTDNADVNVIFAKATSTPAADGALTTISVHVNSILSGSPNVCAALYSDNAGVPGSLLASNTVGVAAGAHSWIDVPVSYASLVAGTQYWLAFRSAANGSDFSVDFDTNGSLTEGYFLSGSPFPSSASGATGFANERFSIYATYTLAGPQAATQRESFGLSWPPRSREIG